MSPPSDNVRPRLRLLRALLPGVEVVVDSLSTVRPVDKHVTSSADAIPHALARGEADVGVWWDLPARSPGIPIARSIIDETEILVASNAAANLPDRALTAADLARTPCVGSARLGSEVLSAFLQRFAFAGEPILLGNPEVLAHSSSSPMFSLVPGAPDVAKLHPDLKVVPLVDPIRAQLHLGHREEVSDTVGLFDELAA